MPAKANPAAAAASSAAGSAPGTARSSVAGAGFASPIYRDEPLNHGTLAELQEGFRVLTQGQKVNLVSCKEMCEVMKLYGLHTSDEEMYDLLRVAHQDERTDGLEFYEFVNLMTHQVSGSMESELKSAFSEYDAGKTGLIDRKHFTEMFVTMGEQSQSEELEEILALAEECERNGKIDYNKFVADLVLRVNHM